MHAASIIRLQPGDLTQLEKLLGLNHLPWQDCADQLQHFFGQFEQGQLVATGGLEPAGACALLRSVVVDQGHRGQGRGLAMVEFLLRKARARKLNAVYLLTESAESYFESLGFVMQERELAPDAVRETRQFDSLCPQNASCMVLDLTSDL